MVEIFPPGKFKSELQGLAFQGLEGVRPSELGRKGSFTLGFRGLRFRV